MTTLESRYEERIASFARERAQLLAQNAPPEALEAVHQQEMEYILATAPYIQEYSEAQQIAPSDQRPTGAMDSFMMVTSKNNRNAVFQKYLFAVEKDASAEVPCAREDTEYVCQRCAEAMVICTRQSMMVCSTCGVVRPYIGTTEANLSYQEEVARNVVSSFSYKRLNHFTEILNSIQARATTEIPPEVILSIKAEFKKARASTRSEITPARVKQHMKKLNYNKYYEHAAYVCTLINGVPAPQLDDELEGTLRRMFLAIQDPFERAIKGTPRKNFLNYKYVMYKFSEILDRPDLLCHFSLLKSAQKLHEQDVIFRQICAELGWKFSPSV